jgi:hypothetical protein
MENNLIRIRTLFNTAHLDKNDCNELIQLTVNSSNEVERAYLAAGLMVSSKYLINPFKISKIFNEGKVQLEDLVSENFEEAEIRFLRYSIQLNTPKFIGYSKNIDEDRLVLVNYIKANRNSELTNHMMIFLKDTNDAVLKLVE